MISSFVVLVISSVTIFTSAIDPNIIFINDSTSSILVKNANDWFCVKGNGYSFGNWFSQIVIEVEDTGGNTGDLPWCVTFFLVFSATINNFRRIQFFRFSVKGLSTDDIEAHLRSAAVKVFPDLEDTTKRSISDLPDLATESSFIRDIVSNCPAPWSRNKLKCKMKFSTAGTSCVNVKTDGHRNRRIHISTRQEEFDVQLIINLIAGFILLYYAHECSKSKFFQFASGSSVFVVLGLFLLIYFLIVRRFSGGNLMMKSVGSFLGFFILYSSTVYYMVLKHLK